jgi:hypothetical protein
MKTLQFPDGTIDLELSEAGLSPDGVAGGLRLKNVVVWMRFNFNDKYGGWERTCETSLEKAVYTFSLFSTVGEAGTSVEAMALGVL